MIIVDTLKHNRFTQVNIPSASDLFARVGQRVAPSSSYSGEETLDPSINKVDAVKKVTSEDLEPVDGK